MFKGKKYLAIIPARGGSKGLPRKNIKILKDKPLIGWTIEIALQSKFLDKIIVSSDDDEIISVAKNYGNIVPFKRPDFLATDKSTSFSVVEHAIDFLEKNGESYDYVVLMEPTSPLRKIDDIDKMIKKIGSSNSSFDAIISIGEVALHPSSMKRITKNEFITNFNKSLKKATRRQDNEKVFFPFGVAYIVRTDILIKEKTFYPEKSTYFLIDRYQCFEIDDIYDFIIIEKIIEYEKI